MGTPKEDFERWKWIPGYKGFYKVSTLGRIKSVPRCIYDKRGQARRIRGMIKVPTLVGGYQQVILSKKNIQKCCAVHRLVLLTFIGKRPPGLMGCHKDGNSTNNCLSNLRYDTQHANQEDRVVHGTDSRGTKSSRAKFTADQVVKIREEYDTGNWSTPRLAKRYGVSVSTVSTIVKRRAYKNIGADGELLSAQNQLNEVPSRTPMKVKAFGKELTLREWSSLTGISPALIKNRLDRGWTKRDAVSKPTQTSNLAR